MDRARGPLSVSLLCVAHLLARSSGAQQQPQTTCAADGIVVNAATGETIARAQVVAVGSGTPSGAASDGQGHWSLAGLPCGAVQFNGTKPGFLSNVYGQGRPAAGLKPVVLRDGSPAHDIKIALQPQAVATGKVVDENGDPLMNVQIQAFTSMIMEGKKSWQARGSAQTDDIGQYRIHSLNPGKYIVCARGGNFISGLDLAARRSMLMESCYPGPLEGASSAAIDLGAGRDSKIDFTLTPKQGYSIRGTISGMESNGGAGLMLRKRGIAAFGGGGGNTAVRKDGSFEITGVAPGAYTLQANIYGQGRRLVGEVPVDVGSGDVDGVSISLGSGFEITGAVTIESTGKNTAVASGVSTGVISPRLVSGGFEGSGLMAASGMVAGQGAGPVNILLRSPEGMFGPGQLKWDEGRTKFTMSDIVTGKYSLQVTAKAGYYVKSATLHGQDVLNTDITLQQSVGPVEIVIADDSGVVQGTLNGSDSVPLSGQLLLFSEKNAGGRPLFAFSNTQGKYTFPNVPPGDYRIYSWNDPTQAEYANPDWMKQFGGSGILVSVSSGQSAQVDVVQTNVP